MINFSGLFLQYPLGTTSPTLREGRPTPTTAILSAALSAVIPKLDVFAKQKVVPAYYTSFTMTHTNAVLIQKSAKNGPKIVSHVVILSIHLKIIAT